MPRKIIRFRLIHLFILMTVVAIGVPLYLLINEYRHKRHVRNVEAFWTDMRDIQNSEGKLDEAIAITRKHNYHDSSKALGQEETRRIRNRILNETWEGWVLVEKQ